MIQHEFRRSPRRERGPNVYNYSPYPEKAEVKPVGNAYAQSSTGLPQVKKFRMSSGFIW